MATGLLTLPRGRERRPQPTDDLVIHHVLVGPRCSRVDFGRRRPRDCASSGGNSGFFNLGEGGTKRDAVRVLQAEGWRFVGGAWVCPACLSRDAERRSTQSTSRQP